MSDVYLSGKYVGTVEDGEAFTNSMREERRRGSLSENVNVYYNSANDEVHIEAAKGRLRRPLIVVREGRTMLTTEHVEKLEKNELKWSDLVKQGVIEYMDAAEEENALVAFFEEELTPDHTHV